MAWSLKYGRELDKWFEALATMEALGSLGAFHFNHASFVFPAMQDELAIRAHNIGHPLMDPNKAVLNDLNIGEESRLHIITGSNMSGKSTYMRTIGLNLLLAHTGAPVFAESFTFRPMRILTSFHHIDSLEESTSYFFAELKALQSIVHSLGEPVPALVLLDEVMRGTNSQDKHDGTALLIKKLLQFQCLSLLATHDTALGELQQQYPDAIENYCFESELDEQGLHFDFRHRPGVAQTRNATYLMRKMGIV
jgi:DNA mismatch repair ATPase MutS